MFIIIDTENNIIASSSKQPNAQDLLDNNLTALQKDLNADGLPDDIALLQFDGTNFSLKPDPVESDENKDLKSIYSRLFFNATDELKKENKLLTDKFKNYKDKTKE